MINKVSKPTTTIVDLLRHGQPISDGRLAGQFDAELTESGWQQMSSTMTDLQNYDQVISSPLSRCQAFAQKYCGQHNLPLTIDQQWQEMSFGDWDGIHYSELHEQAPSALSDFWADPWNHTPPNGEPMADFHQRVEAAWQQLLTNHAGRHILLVCHSGIIRMIFAMLLDIDLRKNIVMSRLNIPYGCLSRIEVYQDEQGKKWPRLMFMNKQGVNQ